MFHTIKQLEERNVASEVNCIVWSHRTDLVALSNTKGEVSLHRLTWTKAWTLNPPKEGVTVSGIAWKPDGKVLAVAYTNGTVVLVTVESRAVITSFEIPEEVSFISWVQEKSEVSSKDTLNINTDDTDTLKFIDLSKSYLRDPPPVSHLEGSINFEDIKGLTSFLQEQSKFSLLVIGTKEGTIHLRVFGCLKCLNLRVGEHINYTGSIKNIHFTEDLSKMFVTVVDQENNISTVLFKSQIFTTHRSELYHVTMKYIKLYELILYLGKIITNLIETWESILLEIDKKLSKYANQVPEGGVTADFLELLMFGTFTERMEEFLIHDLSKKGLEKFGQTMEISYSNIQSYLFRHIIKYSQNGVYHLSELKGMANFEEIFGAIGLNVDQIEQAIKSTGAFIIKACEMQQIINHSVINYKAFFRWLYASIMRLMEESIPSDIQKMTQQDLACITEFLQNFDNYGEVDKKGSMFIMERIGQYLVDSDLTIKPDMTGNDWTQFLEENQCLKNHDSILQHYVDKSLVQVFNEFKRNVEKVFDSPVKRISQQVVPLNNICYFNLNVNSIKVSSINISDDILLFAFLKSRTNVYLFQINVNEKCQCVGRGGCMFFTQSSTLDDESDEVFDIVDTKFYSPTILSVLLQESPPNKRGIILQLPLAQTLQKLESLNIYNNLEHEYIPNINKPLFDQKIIKNVDMPVCEFSVSGSRRVSIVLAENKRKIKLFEMECEEDEEEDTEMTSMIKDDVSML